MQPITYRVTVERRLQHRKAKYHTTVRTCAKPTSEGFKRALSCSLKGLGVTPEVGDEVRLERVGHPDIYVTGEGINQLRFEIARL